MEIDPAAPRSVLASDSSAGLHGLLAQLPSARIVQLDWHGRPVWLKRPEVRPSLRWWLQKGNPLRAFRREVEGLQTLASQDGAVPIILHAGTDFLFLADAGRSLETLLDDPASERGTHQVAVVGAARVLAGLHARGQAHGRPYLRDICWDGVRIALIDLERFQPHGSAWRQGLDLVMFLASLLAHPAGAAHLVPAMAAYRALAPKGALRAAKLWIALIQPLGPLARAVCRFKPDNREVAGYVRLLDAWRGLH